MSKYSAIDDQLTLLIGTIIEINYLTMYIYSFDKSKSVEVPGGVI